MDLNKIIYKRQDIGNLQINSLRALNIAFGIDKNFALGMGVLMVSILENNAGRQVNFHIFTDELLDDDLVRLEEVGDKYKDCRISIYYMDGAFFNKLPAWYIWTAATWYRFIAPVELLGKVKYLWYMDSDIVCIGKMEDVALSEKMVLAAEGAEAVGQEAIRLKRFLQSGPMRMFNGGVLYIDVPLWNKENITNRAFEAVMKEPDKFGGLDGDALLYAVQQNWQYMDNKYNYVYNLSRDHKELPEGKVLIHFAGTGKPWQVWSQDNEIVPLWSKYKEISPWRNCPMQMPKTYKQAKFMLKAMRRKGNVVGITKWFVLYSVYKIKEKVFR